MSRYIRQRDNGVCISCGKKDDWKKMQAGHYIPKSRGLSIYFEEKNVHCQCVSCNIYRSGNLSDYAVQMVRKYGANILEELDKQRRLTIKYTKQDYYDMIEYYKKKTKEDK